MKENKSRFRRRLELVWGKILKPYRIVVINPFTFEEKHKWQLTRLNVFVVMVLVVFSIALSTYFIISYTPFKHTIPGYPTEQEQLRTERLDRNNLERLEGLLIEMEQKEQYITNLLAVIKGELATMPDSASQQPQLQEVSFPVSKEDSLLRAMVAEEERLNLSRPTQTGGKMDLANILLFRPIDGKLTNTFNKQEGHLGVDIIAPKNEPVKATLGGTVVFASWTSDNGYVIQIQHPYNLISVYKHNAVLLTKVGDLVRAGEAISFIGNSGELSEGPHLHFELWQNGQALNPTEYISF